MFSLLVDMVENIVEKRENAGLQHFLLFLGYFHRTSSSRSSKIGKVQHRVKCTQKDFWPSQHHRGYPANLWKQLTLNKGVEEGMS